MASLRIVAQALVDALLAGEGDARELGDRWATALGLEQAPRWLRGLAGRMLARRDALPRGAEAALVDAIANDRRFQRAAAASGGLTIRRWPTADPTFAPAPGPPTGWRVPALATPGELASFLGITVAELDWLAGTRGRAGRSPGPLAHYTHQWIPKRSGGLRLLEAPKPRLRAVQRRLLHEILDAVPAHEAAHGFRRGRSVHTHARVHARAPAVVVVDLAQFFTSVRASRIFALFRTLGYPERVARSLTGLVTAVAPLELWDDAPAPSSASEVRERFTVRRSLRAPHLPQGAPTSPALANLAAYGLDVRLASASAAWRARYTRYADDLTFSGDPAFGRASRRFVTMVEGIVREEGFRVNAAKTRVRSQSARQEVTGLVVNEAPAVARPEREALEAILFNTKRDGPSRQNRERHPDFKAHLAGRIAWVAAANPRHAVRLRELFDAIDWTR